MRLIEYKAPQSTIFERYIDIGYCERDYNFICFYSDTSIGSLSEKMKYHSYSDWYNEFKSNDIGSQLVTLNFYLREYNGWNNSSIIDKQYFSSLYGEKVTQIISDNFEYLMGINSRWFIHQSSLFQGLDFGFIEGVDDQIISAKVSVDGVKTEVIFCDGSIMRFLDKDDTITSFYVLEEDFVFLKSEIESVVNKFQF